MEVPFGSDVIQKFIPHRYPFLLIDRVEILEPGRSITAVKSVSISDPILQGHFPGNPVFPGVLIVEALAQAACVLAGMMGDDKQDREVLLAQIQDVRFKRPVVPGDTVYLNVETKKSRKPFYWFAGEAYVEGKLVAKATFSASIR